MGPKPNPSKSNGDLGARMLGRAQESRVSASYGFGSDALAGY
jgi:hypothetical protein